MEHKNRNFIKVFGIFTAVVLLCTFFSKSFYNYRIPVVTVSLPKQGCLNMTVEGTTEISYSKISTVYGEVDGRVSRILAEAGDEVKTGQTVMQFEISGTGEKVDVAAKKAGVITKIGVEEGMYVSAMQNTVLYQIAEVSTEWSAYLLISDEEREYISVDSVPVFQVEGMAGRITGEIRSIAAYTNQEMSGYQVQMVLESDDRNIVNRQAAVTINNEQQMYDTLIPAAALRKDSEGYYVLALRENDSVLGRGFIAHRMSVDLLDSDKEYCAVRGLPTDEYVILAATDMIEDGSNVYYEGEGAL